MEGLGVGVLLGPMVVHVHLVVLQCVLESTIDLLLKQYTKWSLSTLVIGETEQRLKHIGKSVIDSFELQEFNKYRFERFGHPIRWARKSYMEITDNTYCADNNSMYCRDGPKQYDLRLRLLPNPQTHVPYNLGRDSPNLCQLWLV
jgi:hypothetical protein